MTTTVLAVLDPIPPQLLFSTAVRLALAESSRIEVDQVITFDPDGFPSRVSYATRSSDGSRLLADVTEVTASGRQLPTADFIPLPTWVPAYGLLTLATPDREVPLAPTVADLHAWLVARLTDYLITSGIGWVWTSTGVWSRFCDWHDTLTPSAPLGDPFAWQASLEEAR